MRVVLSERFFYAATAVVVLLAMGWVHVLVYGLGLALALALLVVSVWEYFQLRELAKSVHVDRPIPDRLSLGDYQDITYYLRNEGGQAVQVWVEDELPDQLQVREGLFRLQLAAGEEVERGYPVRSLQRGDYDFGRVVLQVGKQRPGLLRLSVPHMQSGQSKVYPSVIQMRKYALQVFAQTARMTGIRRIRAIGDNDEFEHLRQYRQGDNIKAINWKATSRKGELIVNQYQDTRSQRILCIIDKGRTMEMPFDGLSLLDHSINSALVISNIVLRKYDRAGLLTFNQEVETLLQADHRSSQLDAIATALYNQQTSFMESNYEELYITLRRKVSTRSILFLFTNFETESELERALPYLQRISKRHLLVVISFINTELLAASRMACRDEADIFTQTIADDFKYQKLKVMRQLEHHGIMTIYTTPAQLSINVINKYLEIKAKRMR